jgi:hypothetical protein
MSKGEIVGILPRHARKVFRVNFCESNSSDGAVIGYWSSKRDAEAGAYRQGWYDSPGNVHETVVVVLEDGKIYELASHIPVAVDITHPAADAIQQQREAALAKLTLAEQRLLGVA